MKKTQSLKLMLLGLFASVSTSALATVGDIFPDTGSGLICKELDGGKAKVLGVSTVNPTTKTVTIPTDVYNGFDFTSGSAKKLQITQVSDNWYYAIDIVYVQNGIALSTTPLTTTNLLEVDPLTLIIDAAELKSIGTEALRPLNGNLGKFEVTATAGLEAIPDYAFCGASRPVDADKVAEGVATALEGQAFTQGALDAVNELINDQPAIKKGKFVGRGDYAKYDGFQVYKLMKYVPSGNFTPTDQDLLYIVDESVKDADGNFAAYKVDQGNGTVAAEPEFYTNFTKDAAGKVVKDGLYNKCANPGYDQDPIQVAQAVGEDFTTIPANAVKGLQTLGTAAANTYNTLTQAKTDYLNSAKYADMQTWLGTLDAAVQTALAKKNQAAEIKSFWDASNEDIHAAINSPSATTFDKIKASEDVWNRYIQCYNKVKDANYPSTGSYTDPATGVLYFAYNPDLEFEKINQKYDDAVAAKAAGEKIVNSDIAYNDGTTIPKDAQGNQLQKVREAASGGYEFEPSSAATGMTLAMLNDAIAAAATENDKYNGADGSLANALALKENLQNQIDNFPTAQEIEDALKEDPANWKYVVGENKKLSEVNIESAGALKTIGKSAFQNTPNAEFKTDVDLPVTIETIKDNAFNGAKKVNPTFTTLVNIKEIQDFAFANSGATNGDFSGASNLDKFGTNVFDDCSLTNLLLQGTKLEAIPGKLAYDPAPKIGLHKEKAKFVDACGYFHNYDITKDDDVTALKALGFTNEEIAAPSAAGSKNGGDLEVNTSLLEISLPAAITTIPDMRYAYCINLATLTGGVPAGVTTIGDYAFYYTKIPAFDLSLLTKLVYIGAGAFGGNSSLTTVTLPTAAAEGVAGVTELPANVFTCDANLQTVVLNPEIQCLPEGLFEGTSVETLDLSNTQVTVVPDLFHATAKNPNTTLKYVILPDTEYAADNQTMTKRGVRVIGDNAFAHMHELIGQSATVKKFVVPASVVLMGSSVFQDDQKLEEVEFTKYSKLTKLGSETFNSTPALKKVTFITENCIDKDEVKIALGDHAIEYLTGCYDDDLEDIIDDDNMFSFTEWNLFGSVGRTIHPDVIVSKESYDALITDYYGIGYEQGYTNLIPYEETLIVKGPYKDSNDKDMWATTFFSPNAGIWVPMEASKQNGANVMVWTAYQDYDVIYAYGAKHNNKYYKIPACGKFDQDDLVEDVDYPIVEALIEQANAASPARRFEDGDGNGNSTIIKIPIDGISFGDTPLEELEGLDDDEIEFIPGISSIPSKAIEKFAKQTRKGTYVIGPTQYYQPGSAAVIITSDKSDPVNYEYHSTANFKYQSTLDWKNELKVTGRALSTTKDDDVYKFSADTEWGFFHQVADIPAGKVVFPMSSYQGTAYPEFKTPAKLSRVSIVFLDGEFTDINDVKQYVEKMKQSGDIYDMRGMKVTAPVSGKMYIQNGKKFIQK